MYYQKRFYEIRLEIYNIFVLKNILKRTRFNTKCKNKSLIGIFKYIFLIHSNTMHSEKYIKYKKINPYIRFDLGVINVPC